MSLGQRHLVGFPRVSLPPNTKRRLCWSRALGGDEYLNEILALSHTFCKKLGHAIKLALHAVEALCDADWVVEDSILGVVRVCLVIGLELIEVEDVADEL